MDCITIRGDRVMLGILENFLRARELQKVQGLRGGLLVFWQLRCRGRRPVDVVPSDRERATVVGTTMELVRGKVDVGCLLLLKEPGVTVSVRRNGHQFAELTYAQTGDVRAELSRRRY